MTATIEHSISARVDEYIKTLQWSPEATEHEKTLVMGNLRGFASYLASTENKTKVNNSKKGAERIFLVPTKWGAFTVLERPRDAKYIEYVNIDLLDGQVVGSLESTVDSDSARRAADEIDALLVPLRDYDKSPGIDAIAAIISKHFAAAQPAAIAGRVVNISTHGEPTRARLQEIQTSVSNGYERECRELGWSKSLQSALRDLHFLLTFFQDDVANDAAPADNDAESVALIIPTCGDCPFVDHSGAFTPGGAKDICGHKDAADHFAPFVGPGNEIEHYHWKHRIVNRNTAPPAQCPLRATTTTKGAR